MIKIIRNMMVMNNVIIDTMMAHFDDDCDDDVDS